MKYIIALCLVMKCCHNVMQFLFGGVFEYAKFGVVVLLLVYICNTSNVLAVCIVACVGISN